MRQLGGRPGSKLPAARAFSGAASPPSRDGTGSGSAQSTAERVATSTAPHGGGLPEKAGSSTPSSALVAAGRAASASKAAAARVSARIAIAPVIRVPAHRLIDSRVRRREASRPRRGGEKMAIERAPDVEEQLRQGSEAFRRSDRAFFGRFTSRHESALLVGSAAHEVARGHDAIVGLMETELDQRSSEYPRLELGDIDAWRDGEIGWATALGEFQLSADA